MTVTHANKAKPLPNARPRAAKWTNAFSPKTLYRIKQIAGWVPVSLRKGLTYWSWRWFLNQAQQWTRADIERWQLLRLQTMIRLAYENTEGYRQLYRKAGIRPEDIRTLDDLAHIPFITKEMLRENLDTFSVQRRERKYITTGGSTGIPFGFYQSRHNLRIEDAFVETDWTTFGWRMGKPCLVLRGSFVGCEERFWNYNPYRRELCLSSYFLSERTLSRYLDVMRQSEIRTLQAYPSSLNLLCDLLSETDAGNSLDLDLILLASENVYDWQREKFKKVFPKARIFDFYGQSEHVALGAWCPNRQEYHLWPFYGITEILDPANRPVCEGQEGEIVATSFLNDVTPFIRYRTLDHAIRGQLGCPDCRRAFQLLTRIAGRAQEVIKTRTGRYIAMTAINMHDDIFDSLRQFQFYQDQPGNVVFKYIPKTTLDDAQLASIHQRLMVKLGDDVTLSMLRVEEIPRTSAGKFRFLDQRLDIKYGDA